jgi:hypothetical protein
VVSGQLHVPTGWVPEPVWTLWRRKQLIAPAGNLTLAVQPAAFRSTDWAVAASQINSIYDLFNDGVTSSECSESEGRILSELKKMWMEAAVVWVGLLSGNLLGETGETTKNFRIASFWAHIWIRDLKVTKWKRRLAYAFVWFQFQGQNVQCVGGYATFDKFPGRHQLFACTLAGWKELCMCGWIYICIDKCIPLKYGIIKN